ncbi:hypothetical protein BpHYR1_003155 [Brachionus plicatilis]|uniref:Uncharacterized protein n=1 Tax=Brachionus plicatilis TaxID=10195 RepID=A0A3M7PK37_BRAPC|nr:hypothetical protein BpHYR1_003155 [Brachionus plicatilis]
MKILVLYESKTHIFISKNERYFSVILRATHDTYAESTGVLFNGCQVNQTKMKKRKKRDTDCNTVCSEADFSTGDENMSKDDLEQACNFDCSVIVFITLISERLSVIYKILVFYIKQIYIKNPSDSNFVDGPLSCLVEQNTT